MIALLDGDTVRAPAPGWFHRRLQADHLVAPDDVIGELDVLGRIIPLVAPRIRGIVKLAFADARRSVAYGDVLFRVETTAGLDGRDLRTAGSAAEGRRGSIDAPAAAPRAETGLVFRAPTSGRFYGRPSPDKPPFVTAGAELVAGTTVCLLEVMKTFHRVTYSGERARVRELLVAEGADVNAGDPLLALEPVP